MEKKVASVSTIGVNSFYSLKKYIKFCGSCVYLRENAYFCIALRKRLMNDVV